MEGGKVYNFDNRWSARADPPHVPGQQDHLHLMLKGNQVCVVNRDGTPSHNSTIELPSYIRTKVKKLGYNIEEGVLWDRLLVEATVEGLVPILAANIQAIEHRSV